jgi:hypothetical protein
VDYQLAYQLGRTNDDNLIIRNLPLFLSDAARAWLEHLPPAQISNWDDLVKAFTGNFQGTYVRPGNSWDLRSCRQQPGESLWDYIRRFSKQRTELPNITDSDVIGAFLAGTTCRDLVSKLGRKTPTRASELMDIATKFASGQEAVKAIFRKDKQPQGRQPEDFPEAFAQRGARKKGKKKSQAKHDAADADLVAAAEHRNPRKPPGGANLFDKMLKESCPYHQDPVKHTLEECVMLRRYFHKARPPAEGGRAHNNDKKEDHKAEEFLEVHDCFMIYGGQVANASARHRKQEHREVCSVKVVAPVYLDWPDKPITFDQGNHPDRVPSSAKYPLVVDPVIGNVRLTKVLMDGGSSLNIIYVETLGLLQIDPGRRGTLSRDHPRETRPTPWATRSAHLLWDSLQLPKGNPQVRGGRVPRNLPRSAGETMLRQVHGRPQLHLPQAQDVGPQRGHHSWLHVPTRVRMRRGVRGVRRGPR